MRPERIESFHLDTFIEQTLREDAVTAIDATTLKMLVDRILVKDDGIEVQFSCGVSIEKEYVRLSTSPQTDGNSGFAGTVFLGMVEKFMFFRYNNLDKSGFMEKPKELLLYL